MPRRAAPDPTSARIESLHRTLPREFVAKRNALARELSAAGDPRAGVVAALPRPTLPVWSINLAAREDPDAVEGLLRSAEQVVRAHRLVMGGASGEALLAANRGLGAALDRAVTSAARLARDAGSPLAAPMMLRARTTLRSMALGDERAREMLRAGRVPSESADAGVEGLERLSPLRPPPAAAARAPREDGGARDRAALAAARRSARAAEKDLGRAEAEVTRLQDDLKDAQRRAEEVERRVRGAQARASEARRRAEEARRALSHLERE